MDTQKSVHCKFGRLKFEVPGYQFQRYPMSLMLLPGQAERFLVGSQLVVELEPPVPVVVGVEGLLILVAAVAVVEVVVVVAGQPGFGQQVVEIVQLVGFV